MTPKILDIIKWLSHALKENGPKKAAVNFCSQWIDARSDTFPSLSLFILEETPLEFKGRSFKHELNVHVEGVIQPKKFDDVYQLAADVKRALLKETLPFSVVYQGYEITLPEDGAKVVRILLRFKGIYCEQI